MNTSEETTTTNNPILDELHAVREKLLAEAGGTLDALVDRVQAEEQKSDHPRFEPQRAVRGIEEAKSVENEAKT